MGDYWQEASEILSPFKGAQNFKVMINYYSIIQYSLFIH